MEQSQSRGFLNVMQNLESEQANRTLASKYTKRNDNASTNSRETLNELFTWRNLEVSSKERRKKICHYTFATLVYIAYSVILGILFEQIFFGQDANPPSKWQYKFLKVFLGLLAALFVFKITYYGINMCIFCCAKFPHDLFALKRFKFMISIGLFQFLLFIMGISVMLSFQETRGYLHQRII